MPVIHLFAAAEVGHVALETPVCERAVLTIDQHLGPYLIDVHVVGEVHLVGDVASRGPHVHLQPDDVTPFAKAPLILVQSEELEVEEAVPYSEGLHRTQSGITVELVRAPREEDACVRIQHASLDVVAEIVHGGLYGRRDDRCLREDLIELVFSTKQSVKIQEIILLCRFEQNKYLFPMLYKFNLDKINGQNR